MEQLVAQRLVPGILVKIMRSNGVIQSASITTVNMDRSSVNVEWKEGDTNKGKEISFSDVFTVNPELIEAVWATQTVKENMPPQKNMSQNQKRKTISKIPAPKEVLRSRTSRMTAIHETLPCENDMEVEPSAPPPAAPISSLPAIRSRSTKLNGAGENRSMVRMSEISEESLASTIKNNQARRKSNIVKEMEKMKSKREEQRAQNSEMRTKRTQAVSSDVVYGCFIQSRKYSVDCCNAVSIILQMGACIVCID
ncbi:kinesin KIF2C isoform X2 [Pelobates cultripes]|uniref:Kinesin KIF2C isoform X2 n=1 Tax=Pelobates cultripes TaxID=61616 RepID=A0AAD1WJR4_PELCU|nr:kinesin KIF2C isoform X2 [Pelobates cultripes]